MRWAGVVALVVTLVAACEAERPPGLKSLPPASPTPHALIGPDVSLRVGCGGRITAPFASVSDQGTGATTWSVSLAGSPAFTMNELDFVSKAFQAAQVALVSFSPPLTAVPGDVFDAVATVRAVNDAFPAETVKLHGEVAMTDLAPHETIVDFGDVEANTFVSKRLTFPIPSTSLRALPPPSQPPFSFQLMGTTMIDETYWILVFAPEPGDYTMDAEWTAAADPMALPAPCGWRKTIPIHVRIVPRAAD